MGTNLRAIRLKEGAREIIDACESSVFLCGPAIDSGKQSAILRNEIHQKLQEINGFFVVLGEDDGLKALQKDRILDAQTAELHCVRDFRGYGAIIIIADSVGSYCELGLFNWLYAYEESPRAECHKEECPREERPRFFQHIKDFFVIIDKQHQHKESYLIQGPIANLEQFNSTIYYCDFTSFQTDEFITEIRRRRDTFALNTYGKR